MLKLLHAGCQRIIGKIRNLSLFRRYPAAKELAKYSLVGNTSNLIDLGLYIYFTRAFVFWREYYLLANVLSIMIGSIARFILHKNWTFRHAGGSTRDQYLKFIILMLTSLILSAAILFFVVERFYLNDIVGKIIATAIVTLIVYYLTKVWVFKKQKFFNNF